MKSILAFGDSNTWGFVPGTRQMERFPWEVRWTGILQKKKEGTAGLPMFYMRNSGIWG